MKYNYLLLLIAFSVGGIAIAQDLIILKNGDELKTIVTKVTSSEIEYKIFSVPEAPSLTISNSEVLLIKYESGAINLIKGAEEPEKQAVESQLYYDGAELASVVGPKYIGVIVAAAGSAISTNQQTAAAGFVMMLTGSIFYTVFQIIQDVKTARLGHAVGDLYELERRRSNFLKDDSSLEDNNPNQPTIAEVKTEEKKLGPLKLDLSDKIIYTTKKGESYEATLVFFDSNYYFINYIVNGKKKSKAIYPSGYSRLTKIE